MKHLRNELTCLYWTGKDWTGKNLESSKPVNPQELAFMRVVWDFSHVSVNEMFMFVKD